MNKYIGFYDRKKVEVEAESQYAAKLKVIEHFKVPKSRRWAVSALLAEVDVREVVHSPAELP